MDDHLLMYELDADNDDYCPPELVNNLNPETLLILKEEEKERNNNDNKITAR